MTQDYLFESVAINTDGVDGSAYIEHEGGLKVDVSSPLNDAPGTNPEELLGLALSTCFNATLKAILEEHHLEKETRVEVPVQLKKEEDGLSYYFEVYVHAMIQDLPIEEAKKIVEITSHRCPVYKLMHGSHTVHLETKVY